MIVNAGMDPSKCVSILVYEGVRKASDFLKGDLTAFRIGTWHAELPFDLRAVSLRTDTMAAMMADEDTKTGTSFSHKTVVGGLAVGSHGPFDAPPVCTTFRCLWRERYLALDVTIGPICSDGLSEGSEGNFNGELLTIFAQMSNLAQWFL